MDPILRMQEHLLLIRKSLGWSAEMLGEQIGVTRQTINNIESGRSSLTKTQYLAMRSIFDAEMAHSPEDTQMLRVLLDTLVDHPEKLTDPERLRLIMTANLMAPAVLTGSESRETVSKEFLRTMASIIAAAKPGPFDIPSLMMPGMTMSSWLIYSLLSTKKKVKEKNRKS